MNIHEHQAKELLRGYGVTTLQGQACFTVDETVVGEAAGRRARRDRRPRGDRVRRARGHRERQRRGDETSERPRGTHPFFFSSSSIWAFMPSTERFCRTLPLMKMLGVPRTSTF